MSRSTFLILTQVYVPDPASVGQHIADVAAEMVRRNHRVVVLTSARGFDDPSRRYPSRETIDGVEVKRLPLSSFGKRTIFARLLGAAMFLVQAIAHGLFTRKLSGVLVSTSPPMGSLGALAIGTVRRVAVHYWVMDLNPDQMVALGRVSDKALPARAFDVLNRWILGRAASVITLDRYMARRVNRKRDVTHKLTVLPPWPHDDHLACIDHDENRFRHEHRLQGRFVFMYSGNHGLSMPLTTLLGAAVNVRDERASFLFVGGGAGKREVESTLARSPETDIRSLQYQPLRELRYSLSAADVHVVVMRDSLVGIVHPCKVYGAMAVGRPILLFGPENCHVAELLRRYDIGWQVDHGDLDGAVDLIREILETPEHRLRAMGRRAQQAAATSFTRRALCGQLCGVLEGLPCAG